MGRELLEQVHASVNFDRGLLRLSEPSADSTQVPRGSVRIEVSGGWPVVEGLINGVPASILVDTGDRSNLTVFQKFASNSGLDTPFSRATVRDEPARGE